MQIVDGFSETDKAKLTTWIVDRRRFGEPVPHVNSATLDEVRATRPLKLGARKDRLFLALMKSTYPTPAFRFAIGGVVNDTTRFWVNLLSAWTECAVDADLSQLVQMLGDDGYLTTGNNAAIFLTSKGHERLESLEAANLDSKQGFIAMWFDPSMEEAAQGIETAIRDAGYSPLRINNKEHTGDITDAIIGEIRRSRFVVADFTCGTVADAEGKVSGVPRGGVYFEAGFALGLNVEVIWTCRADQMGYVHFDTRQRSHVVWDTPADLREKLARRIGAVIGYGPDAQIGPPQV